jgi:hypothetical protein
MLLNWFLPYPVGQLYSWSLRTLHLVLFPCTYDLLCSVSSLSGQFGPHRLALDAVTLSQALLAHPHSLMVLALLLGTLKWTLLRTLLSQKERVDTYQEQPAWVYYGVKEWLQKPSPLAYVSHKAAKPWPSLRKGRVSPTTTSAACFSLDATQRLLCSGSWDSAWMSYLVKAKASGNVTILLSNLRLWERFRDSHCLLARGLLVD